MLGVAHCGIASSSQPLGTGGWPLLCPAVWLRWDRSCGRLSLPIPRCPDSGTVRSRGQSGACCRVPPQILFLLLPPGFFWSGKGLLSLPLSTVLDRDELMTLTQPSPDPQPQVGGSRKCSNLHERETLETCSVFPLPRCHQNNSSTAHV